jgi:hypothetical protein
MLENIQLDTKMIQIEWLYRKLSNMYKIRRHLGKKFNNLDLKNGSKYFYVPIIMILLQLYTT